jgi:glycolate oxidase FAD binding subunit
MPETSLRPEIDFEILRQIAGEEGLVLDPARLEAVAVDGLLPRAIVRPQTNEQAAELLKYASSNGLKVAIRGGGTKTALGNPISALDLVLSTERLNVVLEYSPADLMIGVQAGANLQQIQNQLELNGQYLPVEGPLSSRATIGGAAAAATSGPSRLTYGPARDWVIGVHFALPEGIIAKGGGRVVKNVAGYDLMKVFVGSLGTLGLILDLNFKLMPLPPATGTLVVTFNKVQAACETALRIIDAGLFPYALTVLDNRAARSLGLDAPEQSAILLVEARNTAQAVERQLRDMSELCRQQGSVRIERIDEADAQKKLWRAVTDYAYTAPLDPAKSAILKAGILPNTTATVLELAHDLAAGQDVEISAVGHPGHGISYLTLAYEDEAAALQIIKEITRQAEAERGSLTVERAPLSLKRQLGDVWGSALSDGELKLMRGIKDKLDPQNTLNPSRFVAGI